MIDYSISFLPFLEPMIGLAVALNLAYIALPRFRYREQIQEHVKEKLEEVKNASEKLKNSPWYKNISRMASIKDGLSKEDKKDFPSGWWSFWYVFLFEKHVDRWVVIIFTCVLISLLALSSAHSAGFYGSILSLDTLSVFSGSNFHIWFAVVIILGITPVLAVMLGSFAVVAGACKYTSTEIQKMKYDFKDDVQNASAPEAKK